MTNTTNQIGVTEAAQILGVHIRTVHRRINRGDFDLVTKLPGVRAPYILDRDEVTYHVGNKRTRIEKS